MRNRAKCKLCKEIIESFHKYDYVECKCGEISISGGNDNFECGSKNWENFVRIDDTGKEVAIKIMDKSKNITEDNTNENLPEAHTREDKVDILRNMVKTYENLPQNALIAPVTGYDLYSTMLVILSILEDKK